METIQLYGEAVLLRPIIKDDVDGIYARLPRRAYLDAYVTYCKRKKTYGPILNRH